MARALLARGNARKAAGDRLLVKANLDFHAVLQYDPSNREVQKHFKRKTQIHSQNEAPWQRTPIEVWDRIASYIPRYHLRSWLFVSPFFHEIAARHIFHTLDIYFGEDQDNLHRGLDIFDRAKDDPVFAARVKSLRIHWAYEEDDMLNLVLRIFKHALPAFKSLEDFEWIGYPEMRAEMVKLVLDSHSHLHSVGMIGWHFDAVGVSGFHDLRKFTLRAEDDDGVSIRGTPYSSHPPSKNLTHLDLVDTLISHIVLARIAHAHNLQSLTLHGTFQEPGPASVVFNSDQIIDGQHTFLPHLRGVQDDHPGLYQSVTMFLRNRRKLRRLDLGSCPWELVHDILPNLTDLRVLGVKIANLTAQEVASLISAIPQQMVAINLSTDESQRPLNEYASLFSKFRSLSFLHMQCPNRQFQVQSDLWISHARSIAYSIPSLDFLGWHGEHFAIARTVSERQWHGNVELKELPTRRRLDCGKGVDLGSDDAAWLERKD
ncbi:hypothetical protein FA13DRAFT_1743319 [Coprinellus micaceus]|uniref:F-box domain-containing protein n=1 Tax=Coprinellus micaceus TaxID=71717 RepID=A0A4Y7SEV5_COPMI|nr:hypothetical protein FA13DRAFT_1743319 [Coprinellus micaceus]